MGNVQRQRDDAGLILDTIVATGDLWAVPERLRLRAAEACTLDEIEITETGDVRGQWSVRQALLQQ